MGMTSVLLSDEDTARIEKYCYNSRMKKSQVLRTALSEYLDREEGLLVDKLVEETERTNPAPTEEEIALFEVDPDRYWAFRRAKEQSGWKLTLVEWENLEALAEMRKRPRWNPEEALARVGSSDEPDPWTLALNELQDELGRVPTQEEVYARLEGHDDTEDEFRDPDTGETNRETMERMRAEERENTLRGPLGPPE